MALCLLLGSTAAQADVLEMPQNETQSPDAGADDVPANLPRRGMSMAQVESEYGPPVTRHPAIGDPPITRWDYDGFSVFFEYRHVLHSVIPKKPQPIYHKDELSPAPEYQTEYE